MKLWHTTLLLLLLPLLFSCSDPEPVRIGFVGGLSGRVADLGIAGRNGVILATEEINRKGGINGRRVELLIRDDQQNPEIAADAVKSLLSEKVDAIIGHMTSAMSIVTAPLVNEAGIVMLSPTSTTPLLSGKDDYFFRVVAATDLYTQTIAGYLAEAGITSVSAIYDSRNLAYTESWLNDFTRNFEKLGGHVVNKISFESGTDLHFSQIAAQVISARPQAVISIANALDTAMFCQQLRKTGSRLPIAACEWAATEQLIDLGGAAVEGVVLDQFFDRDSQIPGYLAFRETYRKRFAGEAGFASVAGYDAANVLFMALLKSPPRGDLKQTLLTIHTFSGLQGDVELDPNGDARRPTFLAKIENGKFKRIR